MMVWCGVKRHVIESVATLVSMGGVGHLGQHYH
jgi:hypothetical protein